MNVISTSIDAESAVPLNVSQYCFGVLFNLMLDISAEPNAKEGVCFRIPSIRASSNIYTGGALYSTNPCVISA